MKTLKTITIKNILKKGLHHQKKYKYENNIYKINLSKIILNVYNFYKAIHTLKLNNIKFLIVYTIKNKIIKKLIKKISSLTSNYYFTTNWRGGFFTNKEFMDKKTTLVRSLIRFRKILRDKYNKCKNRKLLKLILSLKSTSYKKFITTKSILNRYILSSNFIIFLSPKKDSKIIRESKLKQKIIITLDDKKSKISDLSITNNYDKINKQKLVYYLSFFCSV